MVTSRNIDRLVKDLGARGDIAPPAVDALEAALAAGAGADQLARWRDLLGLSGHEPSTQARRLFATHTYLAFLLQGMAGQLLGGRSLHCPEAAIFAWHLEEGAAVLSRRLGRARVRLKEHTFNDALPGHDLAGALHHDLISAGRRHVLGEFYTPAWLAAKLLERLGEPLYLPAVAQGALGGEMRVPTLLDPACGSGALLMPAITALAGHCRQAGLPRSEALRLVLASVAGMDLNPLAVLAARVNCLIALQVLLPRRGRVPRLPFHQADTILGPLPRGGPFDLVVGNPPWIGWQNLSPRYREQTAPLWREAGLFVHSGMDAILGKGKKELSTLMTCQVVHRQLKEGGRLAFVLGGGVWKTSGAAQGFRRLRLGQDDTPLEVLGVDDLGRMQAFPGASTRASLVVLRKGLATRYPVPYRYWLGRTERLDMVAEPVDLSDLTSPWLTAPRSVLPGLRKVLGPTGAGYRARAGVCTWANGVFWLEVLEEKQDGKLLVRNYTTGARRKVDQVTALVEPDLVYPLLRGRDVGPGSASPSLHILLPQDPVTRRGIATARLQEGLPLTWAYLQRFQSALRDRSGYRRYFIRKDRGGGEHETGPFYSLFNVGPYTLAPWKVVWREQARRFTVAALGPEGGRPVIPDHKLMMVPCSTAQEANYLAAVLGSAPAALAVWAYTMEIQQSVHVLENLRVPIFDPDNPLHREPDPKTLWGLTGHEMKEVEQVLAKMGL